jgi:uncharacterized membrane protein
MMKTLLGIFDDPAQARRAIDELHASGLELHDTSIVSRQAQEAQAEAERVSAGEGATIGAVWGGLVGLGALLIPGVGPFIVGGAMLAALTGAATGAIMGSIAGALMQHMGLSEQDALDYEQLVHSGKVLLAIKAHDADADAVRHILAHAGASSIRDNQTDITGSSAPVHVASSGFTSWSGEKELAPGGAVVRGNADMPTRPSAAPVLTPAGLSGVYNAPYDPSYESQRTEIATRQEASNIAAGTEDAYGAKPDGYQNGAIVTEGWEQIGTLNERQDKQTPAEGTDNTKEEADERKDRTA